MNDLLLQEAGNCTFTHCLKFLELENWAQICYLSSFDEFKHQFLKYFLFLSSSLIYGELKVAWYDLELYACIEISFYLTRVSCYCFVFLISQFNPFQSQLVKKRNLKLYNAIDPVFENVSLQSFGHKGCKIFQPEIFQPQNFNPGLFNHELFNYEYLLQPWTFQPWIF